MSEESSFLIPLPAPFSFDECLWYLDRNYDECLHEIRENEIRKAIVIRKQVILVSVTQEDGHLRVNILQGDVNSQTKALLVQYVTDWFDLDRDIAPFYDHLRSDKLLAYMADDYHGLRIMGIPDLFEAICWCIIGQQINLPFAYKLKRRLVEKYGTIIGFEGSTYRIFPGYDVLASATIGELRAMQFSESKATYIIGTAKAFANGTMSRAKIEALPDLPARQKALTSLKGIGLWTANYVLMRSMRERCCIPHGDAGLLKALINHAIIQERKEVSAIARFFEKYTGWESYLVFYLWRSLSTRQ